MICLELVITFFLSVLQLSGRETRHAGQGRSDGQSIWASDLSWPAVHFEYEGMITDQIFIFEKIW